MAREKSPFENWKYLKKTDPEFARDPRAWARRKAIELLRGFREKESKVGWIKAVGCIHQYDGGYALRALSTLR